jgi:hypothetical protein
VILIEFVGLCLESNDTLLFYQNKNLGINKELGGGEFMWVDEFVWVGAAQSSQ